MPRPPLLRFLAGVALAVGFAEPAPAADRDEGTRGKDDFLASALARPILGPGQALAEVADYCADAVPRRPDVETVAEWEAYATRTRADVRDRVVFRGPAAAWRDAKCRVVWLDAIDGGPGYRIKKLRFEAVPGLWVPALLYEPEGLKGKVPVVLNVNGHDGKGKAADYKQVRCINLARRGMLALNVEWFGMGQLRGAEYRHDLINHLDLCGAGGVATHFLALTRALDLLIAHEHADPARVAVTGLSGGGWQTIFVSALDPRVTLTDPVAGYSSFRTRARHYSDLGDSEQTPSDLATVTDYATLTAMMAPRPTLLTFNAKDDCCFAAGHALPPLVEAARPVFALYGKESNLRTHVNHDPGTHNYQADNRQALYRMLGDHFFPGDPSYDPAEIPADAEVKPASALEVALPDDNASLHSLALDLSRPLPRAAALPTDRDAARRWRDDRRARLRSVVRARRYDVQAERVGADEKDGVTVTYWRLKVGRAWSVPVVELTRGEPARTVLIVADGGRKSAAGAVRRGLGDGGGRVLVIDPFYVGESKPSERDYLWALLLAAVGDRPLGVQASQLAAVARWAKSGTRGGPLRVEGVGRRGSVMALVAAALEDSAIDGVAVVEPLGSLKELVEAKTPYTAAPELFCFGLLREFDVLQLAALSAPRPVSVHEPGERAGKELAGLKPWYAIWGVDLE